MSSAVRSENTVITTRKGLVPFGHQEDGEQRDDEHGLEEVDPQAEGPELEQERRDGARA